MQGWSPGLSIERGSPSTDIYVDRERFRQPTSPATIRKTSRATTPVPKLQSPRSSYDEIDEAHVARHAGQ